MALNCVITWWDFPNIILQCANKIRTDGVSEAPNDFNPGIEWAVGILFLIAVGILGSTIVELLYNKSDWYLTPLVNRVVKRYNFTLQRNRLRTMSAHP